LDKDDYASSVSNGFIPDSLFDHFDLDVYTLSIFNMNEVLDTSPGTAILNSDKVLDTSTPDPSPKQVSDELIEISPDPIP
jgi:hypothetical protein